MSRILPGVIANKSLKKQLVNRMTLTFLILPHVPTPETLPSKVVPLLQWASIIAHAQPGISLVEMPSPLRRLKGLERLVEALNDAETLNILSEERETYLRTLDKERRDLDILNSRFEDQLEYAEEKGREEGREEGRHEVRAQAVADVAEFLIAQNIRTVDAYRARWNRDPSGIWLEALEGLERGMLT